MRGPPGATPAPLEPARSGDHKRRTPKLPTEAGRPGFGLADLRRRVLGETATAGGDAANRPIFGGGGGVVGGGWGGYRGGCFGGACNDRQGIVSTLAVLNAQDAVRQASDSYGGCSLRPGDQKALFRSRRPRLLRVSADSAPAGPLFARQPPRAVGAVHHPGPHPLKPPPPSLLPNRNARLRRTILRKPVRPALGCGRGVGAAPLPR